jgi:hypothetical protein
VRIAGEDAQALSPRSAERLSERERQVLETEGMQMPSTGKR